MTTLKELHYEIDDLREENEHYYKLILKQDAELNEAKKMVLHLIEENNYYASENMRLRSLLLKNNISCD